MIDNYLGEEDYDSIDISELTYLKEKHEWLQILNEIAENQPVFFPSGNYDTWIAKVADNILVCTCNNECWDLPNRVHFSEAAKKELLNLGEEGLLLLNPYSYYGLYILFDNFYALPYKITGSEDQNGVYCTKHKYQNLWKTNNGIVCPICVSERRDKIKKINKNIS